MKRKEGFVGQREGVRTNKLLRVFFLFVLLPLFSMAIFCSAVSAEEVKVLDSYSSWRIYNVFKAPVIQDGKEIKPLLLNQSWLDRETPAPASDWTKPGFDDHKWLRGSIYMASYTSYLARACFRGKFTVTEPAKIKTLKINASFQGGAIIYINGQEVARANIIKGEDLAEAYPAEAFLAGNGALH